VGGGEGRRVRPRRRRGGAALAKAGPGLGVALVEEAVALRQAGIDGPSCWLSHLRQYAAAVAAGVRCRLSRAIDGLAAAAASTTIGAPQ
jgi:hypothetical protein